MMRIAYIRVSTVDQNVSRQIKALEKFNIDKFFIEKISAKNTKRPKLKELLEFAREGDVIFIHDFSRLARSTKDLLNIVEQLDEKGIHLISYKENIDTTTVTGKLMLTMIGAIAEFERESILERQREGIAIAKEKGVYKGRKPINIDKDLFNQLLNDYNSRKINKVAFAKKLEISRPTLDKLLKENTIQK
jgi:DNA invertase Pin-like site-specific DNA recombinase